MPTCPKGHPSTAEDYCDECGTPMTGTPVAPVPPAASAVVAVETSGELCPECSNPRDGRFCEVCGHDFLAEPAPDGPASSGAPAPMDSAAPKAGSSSKAGVALKDGGGASPRWQIVATADRAFHARMQADPAAEPVPFPAYCPERRFVLTGGEMLIGRRSRSRGIEPAIDLTGPPEDAGTSHMHALLVPTPEGTWTIVDLDSANGTYLNDGADPIAANQPVPLADGDRVHVGAFTTLTLRST